jgi:general secretion pathway protein A
MYLDHFKLKKEPFGRVPDPEGVWLGGQHARVFDRLREGILDRDGYVALTGDIGTGKTALVKALGREQGLAAIFLTAGGPELSALDVYRLLAAELHLEPGFEDPGEFLAEFNRMLTQACESVQKVVLVVDEAQRLTPAALKELAGLAEQPTRGRRLLKLLLVGQPGLDARLAAAAGEGGPPGTAARCVLEPLTEADARDYIAHRLKAAGGALEVFSPDALRAVHQLSKGLPRLVNTICDHALLYGYSAHRQRIDAGVIRECSRDLSVALDLEQPAEAPAAPPAVAAPARAVPAPAAWLLSADHRRWLVLSAALAAAGLLYLVTR